MIRYLSVCGSFAFLFLCGLQENRLPVLRKRIKILKDASFADIRPENISVAVASSDNSYLNIVMPFTRYADYRIQPAKNRGVCCR